MNAVSRIVENILHSIYFLQMAKKRPVGFKLHYA